MAKYVHHAYKDKVYYLNDGMFGTTVKEYVNGIVKTKLSIENKQSFIDKLTKSGWVISNGNK